MGKIDKDQVMWWDDTHCKCLIESINKSRNYCLYLECNTNRNIGENEEFSSKKIHVLNRKYEKWSWFGLKCEIVTSIHENNDYLSSVGN